MNLYFIITCYYIILILYHVFIFTEQNLISVIFKLNILWANLLLILHAETSLCLLNSDYTYLNNSKHGTCLSDQTPTLTMSEKLKLFFNSKNIPWFEMLKTI